MAERPYTLLSCAVSLDGYLDASTGPRLVLSNEADLDRVDEVRAGCDAILVGAATIRNDDPRLLVRAEARVAARVAAGLPAQPTKVTVTERVKLDPEAAFFRAGPAPRLVYCPSDAVPAARLLLDGAATVVDGGDPVASGRVALHRVATDLHARGVRRLLVEGGGTVLTQFLREGLADELHLVVAPFFVGDQRARRFVDDGCFPFRPGRRAALVETRAVGDVALLRYALSERCPRDGAPR